MDNSPQQQKLLVPSHIGRDFGWQYPSHRRIILFSAGVVVLMAVYRLLTGSPLVDAVIQAVGAGGFTFSAWVIGRELDPDHDLSAYLAAGLTAVALVLWPLPYLLPVGLLVILLRAVNRTMGLPPLLTDNLAVLVTLGLTVAWDGFWPLGLVVALGFALNALLPQPDRRNGLIFAGLALLTVLLNLLFPQPGPGFMAQQVTMIVIGGIAALYALLLLLQPARFQSVGDLTGEALIPARIQAGRWLALVAGLLLFIWGGEVGFSALLPVWAAMLGLSLRMLIRRDQ